MKKILELYLKKEINSFNFYQYIEVEPRQYRDKEIYETQVDSYEPGYKVYFKDGTDTFVELNFILEFIFNNKI